MSDDQNTTQNPIPKENSIPSSPQEPTEPALENTAHSEPVEVPPEALESSPNDFSVKSNDIPPSNSTLMEAESEPKSEEKSALNEPNIELKPEPVSESVEVPESETAQIPVIEPLPVFTSSKPSQKELWQRFLAKVGLGKRKKLDRIMTLFLKNSKITNDEVEKFLHVSDATATRYLSQLEKEGKIKQSGKTGHAVFYQKVI